MTSPLKVVMRKRTRSSFMVVVAMFVAVPAVTHGEPIRLTSGFLFTDFTDCCGPPTDLIASGAGAEVRLFGGWRDISQPFIADGLLNTSFSGVVEGSDAELRLGDEIFELGFFTFTVSIEGPRVPLPPVDDALNPVIVTFPGSFHGLLFGGESPIEIAGRGRGSFRALISPPSPQFARIETFFTFEDSAPIPEPSTILLLSAAGLAGLARRRNTHNTQHGSSL
jgi:hypothetical protein